jgi:hypothetical protein
MLAVARFASRNKAFVHDRVQALEEGPMEEHLRKQVSAKGLAVDLLVVDASDRKPLDCPYLPRVAPFVHKELEPLFIVVADDHTKVAEVEFLPFVVISAIGRVKQLANVNSTDIRNLSSSVPQEVRSVLAKSLQSRWKTMRWNDCSKFI